ncbi:MAG: DUF523 domain-containing protein [Lachnospiraceae bacterium]|nr:DUF523 domain-containing protein [Lachnospiraceae bacterium]
MEHKKCVAVSACLLGENCKYNGGNNENVDLKAFLEANGYEAVPVCPEVLGGLPIPRTPAEIVDGVVRTKDGVSVDREFRLGAEKALTIVQEAGADCVILQSRSPSCGVGRIYSGRFDKTMVDGDGVFVALLKEHGIRAVDVSAYIEVL